MNKSFVLTENVKAFAHTDMNNETVKKLWSNFTLGKSTIEFTSCDGYTFKVGNTALPTLEEGKEYAFCVDENGIAIVGNNYYGLMRGFMALIMKINVRKAPYFIPCMTEQSNYRIKNRMIHICVFPENDLNYIKRLVRLSALCQYTHIVIEFWGTLKYDCMKELAWPEAFTKDQAREIIRECRELGIEPVPMFNMLGHASNSRSGYGKHVVLDQNPELEYLFTPNGWDWNIASDEVKALLKEIRKELYELFGETEYFHIGCDESFFIPNDEELHALLPSYLKDLTYEVEAEGKRPMLWMDMLLEKDTFEGCYAVGNKDEVADIRNSLAKSSVFVDWQYSCFDIPIPSLASLANCGHDVYGAPWYKPDAIPAHIETITQYGLAGIMFTTWQSLAKQMKSILSCAKQCGASTFYWSESSRPSHETATMMRRVTFEAKTYEECGWQKLQIEI